MKLDELLKALAAGGIRLQLQGEGLRCVAPQGALSTQLGAAIKHNKAQLIELLRQSAAEADERGPQAVSITAVAHDAVIPLSHVQERMWLWDCLAGPNHVYNMAVPVVLLEQHFDLQALRHACGVLLQRHAILRTVFHAHGVSARQVILEPWPFEPKVIALSREFGPDQTALRDAELRRILEREARTPFDLSTGPLFRMVVVRLHQRSHIVLALLHHIVSDGWSNQLLVRELTRLYQAHVQGVTLELPPVKLQYADYAAWQRYSPQYRLQMGRQLDYWTRQLQGLPPLLQLPYDRARPDLARHDGAMLSFELDAQLSNGLRALARRHDASLFMLLLAMFQLLLARYSGRSDVVVGSALTSRREAQLEGMIGPCMNMMALRATVLATDSLAAYLQQVRGTVLAAFDHQDVPFEQIVSALRVERSAAYEPIVQVCFVLKALSEDSAALKAAAPTASDIGFELRSIAGYSKFDLTVMTKEEGERIVGWFEYSTELFEPASIERMSTGFESLLRSLIQTASADRDVRLEQIAGVEPLARSGPLQQVPTPASQPAERPRPPFVAPRTAVEQQVAQVWAATLNVQPIGAFDNFFALGGQSLLVMHVVTELCELCAIDLPLKSLFEHQTVAQLSERIELLRSSQSLEAQPAGAVALLPRPTGAEVPLSPGQEGLWVLDRMGMTGAAYNVRIVLELTGPLQQATLRRCFAQIAQRHEVLRTRLVRGTARVLQQIDAVANWELQHLDVSLLVPEEQQRELAALVQQELHRGFDLERGPLVRACVVQRSAHSHVLLFTMSHVIADGWSLAVLTRELSLLYAAYARGADTPLAPLEVQYADYALWQRARLQGDLLQQQLSYWRSRLDGAPAALELPTDRARPAVMSQRGATHRWLLSSQVSAGLKGLALQEQATLFMVLLGAFAVLLTKLSGQEEVVIGTPIAGRSERRLEALIGFFVNTLALRIAVQPALSFRECLRQVRQVALDGYGHQDAPFEAVVQDLRPQRSLARNSIFQVMFTMEHLPAQVLELPGLQLRLASGGQVASKFDLTLSVRELPTQLQCAFEYATDLFDPATIERFAAAFETLLIGIAAEPASVIADLPLLTPQQQEQLVALGTTSIAPCTEQRWVHQLFADRARAAPDAIAVIAADGTLTYGELDARANRLAHHLRGLGVRPEVTVGIALERSSTLLVALLAVLKAGGAYLPLDLEQPPERLVHVLEDSGAALLLTDTERGATNSARLPVQHLALDTLQLAAEPSHAPEVALQGEHLAYVIYTSGSTGRPKGVMLRHYGLSNFLYSMQQVLDLGSQDVLVAVTSLSFDIAALELYLPLISGARVVLAERAVTRDGAALARLIEHSGASVLQSTPAGWRMLRAAGWPSAPTGLKALCGGEVLQADLARDLMTCGVQLWSMYGPTETTIWSAATRVHAERVGIAGPLAATQLYVLDQRLQRVPIGTPGELYIGGAGLARGYLKCATLTAQRFIANPFAAPGDRMYRTGDRVRWRDGQLEFLGRIDHQVKVRGFRIELGEIEAQLLAHPTVREAVVVSHDGASGTRLVAYVAAMHGSVIESNALRAALNRSLPDYMVPSLIVVVASLPVNRSGKVDRAALPLPDEALLARQQYTPPATATETLVVKLLQELLHRERIGRDDDFFELGGHSLLAMQLAARLGERLALEVPMTSLFEAPMVKVFAERVDALRELQAVAQSGDGGEEGWI